MEMMKVESCDASSCAYNKDNQCHALAITVKTSSPASCSTFFEGGIKGSSNGSKAGIGACTESHCEHNKGLECTFAEGIAIALSSGNAVCTTCNT